MPRGGRKRGNKGGATDAAQRKKQICFCSVKGCVYTSSDAFNLRRHQVICEQKAHSALTGQNASKGTRTYSNGRYVGDIVDNLMHGHGIYTFTRGPGCGQILKATFVNDQCTGPGIVSYPDGDMYDGYFLDFMKHGEGTYYWTSGEKHKGTFVNDECTGPGIRSFPDGNVYDGSHLAYLKHGEGTYTFSDGTKYIGSYVDDKCHGQGINIFASGETYEGSFSHGKWNGQGINTLADGQRYSHYLENLFLFLSKLKSFYILDSKGFLSTT
jgi:hypothetical protein